MAANGNGQGFRAPNGIFLSGNLTKDPELRYTPKGNAVATFRIAVNGAGSGEESGFFTCTAWNSLAENLAETLKKGDRAVVTGTLRHRSYEREDGKKGSSIEILVQDVGPSLVWATAQVTRKAPAEPPQATEALAPEPVGA